MLQGYSVWGVAWLCLQELASSPMPRHESARDAKSDHAGAWLLDEDKDLRKNERESATRGLLWFKSSRVF